jgi:hypothetical protein
MTISGINVRFWNKDTKSYLTPSRMGVTATLTDGNEFVLSAGSSTIERGTGYSERGGGEIFENDVLSDADEGCWVGIVRYSPEEGAFVVVGPEGTISLEEYAWQIGGTTHAPITVVDEDGNEHEEDAEEFLR